jgi:hypothetical protein
LKDFEKLGAFYLGRVYDPAREKTLDQLLLYDSRDLTTHALCIGMTGSGKTGLAIALIEEAALDGVPSIVIDPKGDLGNLLLGFPDLKPSDFRPWIDEAEAARRGETPDDRAARTAETWKEGLAEWGQDGARIARLHSAVELRIFTPASNAGAPLSLLRRLNAPPAALARDTDILRDRVMGSVSGLLALIGVEADPVRSREHILLSLILERAWREGNDVDLPALIHGVQSPPFGKVGIVDLESFFPGSERFAFAMRLNQLLASPGFSAWVEGEPLDVQRLLYTVGGKPRVSILSIAHLSDAERMFFVTVLLSEVLTWMRAQPGTGSLRGILYMDEVAGFFPPVLAPPAKAPMLTLLKQARAFGLGVVLATQNPVDIDYKGLANVGTWFVGRLQTERDKARVMEALGASGGGAHQSWERLLSGLGQRVFLMHNVHDDQPLLFQTRWALSYLRGPLTRAQIEVLMRDRREAGASASVTVTASSAAASLSRPLVPPEVPEVFIARAREPAGEERLVYRPALMGFVRRHFVDARAEVDYWDELTLLRPLSAELSVVDWSEAEVLDGRPPMEAEPAAGASYGILPPEAVQKEAYGQWTGELSSHVHRERPLHLFKSPAAKLHSKPGESEGDFRVRLTQAARERRDEALDRLRQRYAPRLARISERIVKAQERVERERGQYQQQRVDTALWLGAGVLGALLGRKLASAANLGRVGTAVRGVGRAARERDDIRRAEEEVARRKEELAQLEEEFEKETAEIESSDATQEALDTVVLRARKADLAPEVRLAWMPWALRSDGLAAPLNLPRSP